jgi:short-subunit dehydrogenase
MFSAVARAELADDGIVVSTVLPTLTATDFPANALGGLDESPSESWPVEPQTPEEVGEAILELVRTGEATVDLAQRAKAREREGVRSTT